MIINFSDKNAIVTGGTKGIGKSIVLLLITLGCKVIYTGRNEPSDSQLKNGSYQSLDFNNKESIDRFILENITKVSHIDILINNSGINAINPIEETKDEDWKNIMAVNLTGPMRLIKEVSKLMIKNHKGGKILNISSVFGVVSKKKRSSYSASKSGLIGLTRSCALDLAPYNILVNALCPGFTSTELTRSILTKNEIKRLSSEIPLGRFADVSEISKAAAFLCSDLNGFMTGQTLVIDGGFTAK